VQRSTAVSGAGNNDARGGTEPNRAVDTDGSGSETATKRSTSPLIRVGAAVAAVLAVAAGLLFLKVEHRERELTTFYKRAVARAAQQFEVRLQSHAAIVKSLASVARGTGPASRARLAARSARARLQALEVALDAARVQATTAEAWAEATRAQRRASTEQLGRVVDQLDAALRRQPTAAAPLSLTILQARRTVEQAIEERARSDAAAEELRASSHTAFEAIARASQETRKSDTLAEQAAIALRSATRADLSAQRPAETPTATLFAARLEAGHAASQSRDQVAAADAAFEQARAAAAAATAAKARASAADVDAERAEEAALNRSYPLLRRTTSAAGAARARERQRRALEALAPINLERTAASDRADTAEPAKGVTRDAPAEEPATQAIVNDILSSALPSYFPALRECLERQSPELRNRCLMVTLARLGGLDASELQYGECPPDMAAGSRRIRLSNDRRNLIFPGTVEHGFSVGCAGVPVASLLPPPRQTPHFQRKDVSEFEELVLLDRHGEVVLGDRASPLRLEALPGFEPKSAVTSSVRERVSIGGTSYRVFLQPVTVPVDVGCARPQECAKNGAKPSDAAAPGFVIAGLVEESRLGAETGRLTPAAFLWVVLLVAFGLLCIPLGKLWLLGPNSRFSMFDAALLTSAAGIAALLTVLGLWSFGAGYRLSAGIDEKLRSSGAVVAASVSRSVGEAARVLSNFNERSQSLQQELFAQDLERAAAGYSERRAKLENSCAELTTKRENAGLTEWSGFSTGDDSFEVCEVVRYQGDPSPDWKYFFLADQKGRQLAKVTREEHATTPVGIEGRAYFQRALAGRVGCLVPNPTTGRCDHSGFAEIVRATTTGKILLVVAQPGLAQIASADSNSRGVAAITSELSQLQELVLPRGVSMAVVDRTGSVLLHSDKDLEHGHNLLEDVSYDEQVREVMNAELEQDISAEYLGTPVHMHLAPVPGSDWYVVTLAPKSLANLPATDMMLIALGASVGLLFIYLAGLGVSVLYKSVVRTIPRRAALDQEPLFRPNACHRQSYYRAGRTVLILATALCFIALLSPWLPLWLLLCIQLWVAFLAIQWIQRTAIPRPGPISQGANESGASEQMQPLPETWAALGRWLASLKERLPRRIGRRPPRQNSLAFCYSLWWFSLVGIFLIAPASIFFAAAYDLIVDNETRADQVHLAKVLSQKPKCLKQLAGPPRKPSETCPRFVDDGSDTRVSVSDKSARVLPHGVSIHSAETEPQPHRVTSASVFGFAPERWLSLHGLFPLRHLLTWLPSVGLREGGDNLHYRADHTRQWSWTRTMGGVDMDFDDGARTFRMSSALPRLHDVAGRVIERSIVLIAVVALLVFAFGLLYVSLRKLFFLDLIATLRIELKDAAGGTLAERVAKALDASGTHAGVMAHTLTPEQARCLVGACKGHASGPVIVDFDGFTASGKGPNRLPQTGNVVLYSRSSEPLMTLKGEARDAWAAALRNYEFVVPPPALIDAREDCEYSDAYSRSLWSCLSDGEKKVLVQLATTGFAAPHGELGPCLEQLTRRGLLHAATLSIAHPSLTDFVRAEVSAGRCPSKDPASNGSPWDYLKAPLLAAVAVACAALGVSEPELVATGILAPALAAGTPAAVRAIGRAVAR